VPLSLEDVNLIEDGQAVTAENLNRPSVNLTNRTDAVKSSYDVVEDERRTLQGYSVSLGGGSNPAITVTAGDIASIGEKYYSIGMSLGAQLRYYSPNSNFGRLQLTAAELSSYNNSLDSNDWSKHLVRQGDTLAIELDSHPTLASAGVRSLRGARQNASSDIDNAFYSVVGDVDIVKLPARRTVQFDCDLTEETLLTALNQKASTVEAGATYSLDANGVLDTSNADGVELEVSATGGTLYGSVYSITSDSDGKLYITTTTTTSFLDYTSSDPGSIVFKVSKGASEGTYTPDNQQNRSLPPTELSQDKFYIPVVTLEADGIRVHGLGKCPLPVNSGDVEVLGPEGRSVKKYLPGDTHTAEAVLIRNRGNSDQTTGVVSLPGSLADQIQYYGGHIMLQTFSITALSSFADGDTLPTLSAVARVDFNEANATQVERSLISSMYMPPARRSLSVDINELVDATNSGNSYDPSVSVTVSGLDPDSDAKALLRLSFSYVPA
tara:strand:- start:957 stop:2441 length:1485 start_codon:yes stop_codon:yes gene_type:complete